LLLGSILFGIAWFRGGFGAFQVYPSRASLAQSVTVFLVGAYLFVVGVLAQFISIIGDAATFQTQAFLVLICIVAIGVLLVSDRLRLKVQHAFSRYFGRAFYDFRKVWTLASDRLSNPINEDSLCASSARLIAETFNSLSVRVWLLDGLQARLMLGASTAPSAEEAHVMEMPVNASMLQELQPTDRPFNLESAKGGLAERLRQANGVQFRHGGERLAVPLTSNGRQLGVIVVADRVNGEPYTPEEADLLRCVAAQVSATLHTLRVGGELLQAKELEAFQTMSAFFVHDLKNTVSTLNLMLQNLPVHFDNPEFRKDALRGIGNTVDRVNHLIARLSALRNKVELRPVETNLSELVERTIGQLDGLPGVEITRDFQPARSVLADPEHFGSVVSNLLLNARDAAGENKEVRVQIAEVADRVAVSVTDHGCGMTAEFVAKSLFRPFNSTKNKGLGIGMFQCKVLVEAHRGTIEIDSAPGVGTTVRVSLPALARK
jgi:putative PEP-CTERM system histidine kinase